VAGEGERGGGAAGEAHACKFADHACGTLAAVECAGGRGGGYKLRPLLLQPRRSDPGIRARAPPTTIVHEMIMVARYEVAGSR
jgi:hypothetical protein